MKDNMPGMNMPDISFERSMNHNYMILSKCSFFGKSGDQRGDYRTKMLLENHIQGLLPVTHRLINGESRYYYEINSLQSLDRLYAKTEIRYDVLRRLLSGCVSLFDRLEEYLLDGTQIIIKPELIYIDVEKMDPYFVCYPDYEGDVRVNFMEFIDGLLTRIDHTDEHAVMLGYQVYRYTRNPNYVISEIRNMMEHVIAGMTNVEQDTVQQGMESSGGAVSAPVNDSMITVSGSYKSSEFTRLGNFNTNPCKEDTAKLHSKSGKKMENLCGYFHGLNLYPDLIGGIFCVIVALCAGAIVFCARLVSVFQLEGNNELYLYGAMGMALVAAVLFFSCYIKKRRRVQEMELPDDGEEYEYVQYYTAVGDEPDNCRDSGSKAHNMTYGTDSLDKIFCADQNIDISTKDDCPGAGVPGRKGYQDIGSSGKNVRSPGQDDYQDTRYTKPSSSETVFLGDCVVEERMLCGRINGREVNIPLDRLPMTVGKLASVSDFVINDTSVSKMHARFEERGGRVCICDLNSTNGTIHNGELLKINESVILEPGDRLRFGRTSFTYC